MVLLRGLSMQLPASSRLHVASLLGLTGLIAEPMAWLQSLVFERRLKQLQLPSDPVVVIGHWRSGTTYLHQLLSCDPTVVTARNSLTVAPQVALLLRPLLRWWLQITMTDQRPIDAVPWSADDPQEDEIGLARLTMDSHMAGLAFPQDYLHHLGRCVIHQTPEFERKLERFTRLTLLHQDDRTGHLLIKNPAHSGRIPLLLTAFPKARFVFLRRDPIDSIRSLVQVKQRLGALVGLQPPLNERLQVEQTVAAYQQLMQAFEASRPNIPEGQLLEVNYKDLVHQPLETVQRLYQALGLSSWTCAERPIRERVARASRSYNPDPVMLAPGSEQRLQELLCQD